MSRDDQQQPPPATDRIATFETDLNQLEAIVTRLERGDMTLEGALASFEEGARLSRELTATLDHAERRIEMLIKDGSGVRTEPVPKREE